MKVDDENNCIDVKHLHLQRKRIRSLSQCPTNKWGEKSRPCKANWEKPTPEYYMQELDAVLQEPTRFSRTEFFHPQNYDIAYSLFPHTFKKIAEHSKGGITKSEEEIKKILLNKAVETLIGGWREYSYTLTEDPEARKEAFGFFDMGKLKVWNGTDPETGEHIDNTDITCHMGKVEGFMGQFADPVSYEGYIANLEQYPEYAQRGEERTLPAPFVMKLPSQEYYEYILIGGHKRSATALQLDIEVKVWLIDLTI